ncbi:MAG: HD-GYP domain-containing protein [Desulfurella sp.]|uniref:HD-GYP domain-containing protein n=1 Tax=Desulfurella sp. TaxID=1962857 RepID=UPI003CA74C2D
MYLVSVKSLKPNDTLGKAIINEKGQVLLNKGVKLDEYYINILDKYGYQFVYIEDDDTKDIVVEDEITDELKTSAIKTIKKVFDIVTPTKEDNVNDFKEIVKKIENGEIKKKLADSPFIKSIESIAFDVVNSLFETKILNGVASLKKQDNFTYQHCLDVTILSVALANKLLYTKKKLIELAKGCLLHDIGRILINKSLYIQPRKLSNKEFELIKQHPQIGYLVLKDITQVGIIASHITYQHHEQQDGFGYPRGLKGNNLLPVPDKVIEDGYIMPLAEIVAIANVYDALVSPRAYRSAYTPDQAFFIMKRVASQQINIEAFRVFSDIIPVYPIGTTVYILNGKYKNFIGVVSKNNQKSLTRPIVRLLYNSSRRRISPLEIDLEKNPIVSIAGIII